MIYGVTCNGIAGTGTRRDSLYTCKAVCGCKGAQQGVRTASPGQLVGLEGVWRPLVLVAGEQRPQHQQLRHDAARRPGVHRAAGWPSCCKSIAMTTSRNMAQHKCSRQQNSTCADACPQLSAALPGGIEHEYGYCFWKPGWHAAAAHLV